MSDKRFAEAPRKDSAPRFNASVADQRLPSARQVTCWGLWVEGGCLLAALVLASCGWYDLDQPLSHFWRLDLGSVVVWTLAGLCSTFAVAAAVLLIPWRPFHEFREFVFRILIPIFEPLSLTQIALLSASAGIGEEMLFRWCLQGALQSACTTVSGTVGALVVASILFGLCHAMGVMYFLVAALIGGVLGLIMIASGSVVPSILTHGIYDFFAILMLRHASRGKAEHAGVRDQVPE